MYCAAGEFQALIRSISAWVILVLTEISTVVQTIFFQGARSTMCAASGSNQMLNSCRGHIDELRVGGLRIQAGAHEDQFLWPGRRNSGIN